MHARRFLALALCLAFLVPGCGPDASDPAGDAGTRTIVVLTLDALRRDHVGAYTPDGATPRAQTPAIDALLARGTRFEDARTPVPLTLPSHTCMFTGLPPARTGVRLNSQRVASPAARADMPLLAESLAAKGWRCGAFVSAAVLAKSQGLAAGFHTYDDGGLGDVGGTLTVPERAGDATVDRAVAWLGDGSRDTSVFLFVHLFEPHAPYTSGSYRGDVEDCDRIVGRLVEGVARARGADDVVWIVTADHGEALGEMGEATHGLLLTDSVMRVPFGLVGAGPAGVRDDPVTVTDIAPTVAALAGLDGFAARGPGAGKDLRAPGEPDGTRLRIAESLYGHHRYGWAQLLGAVAPGQGQLVMWGTGRSGWFPLLAFGEALERPRPLPTDLGPDLARLGQLIASYKESEMRDRMLDAGGPENPYGAGGPVSPFLPDPENARLPDPHAKAATADLLDNVAQRTVEGVASRRRDHLEREERRVRRVLGDQPRNPEAWFRLGRIHAGLMALAPTEGSKRDAAVAAERAFGKAWVVGRRDPGTLLAWCGINALGREAAMLERLENEVGQLGSDLPCALHLLRARLLAGAGRAGGPAWKAACAAAAKACLSKRERASHGETCG